MPYDSTSEVPDYVPADKKSQWKEVWNSAYQRAIKDGKSKDKAEQSAFAQANAVAGPNTKILQRLNDLSDRLDLWKGRTE